MWPSPAAGQGQWLCSAHLDQGREPGARPSRSPGPGRWGTASCPNSQPVSLRGSFRVSAPAGAVVVMRVAGVAPPPRPLPSGSLVSLPRFWELVPHQAEVVLLVCGHEFKSGFG